MLCWTRSGDALACGIHALNYGLLPPKAENKESLRCWFVTDNQQYGGSISECRAYGSELGADNFDEYSSGAAG